MFPSRRPVHASLLILGVWLVASPWLLEYVDTAAAALVTWLAGPVVVTVAFLTEGAAHGRTAQAVGILAGDMLFLAPWFLGYSDIRLAAVNSWFVGITVSALCAWQFTDHRDRGRSGRGAGHRT